MELQNGKKYSFKPRPKKRKFHKVPQNVIDYLQQNFVADGFELIQTDFCSFKLKKKQKKNSFNTYMFI